MLLIVWQGAWSGLWLILMGVFLMFAARAEEAAVLARRGTDRAWVGPTRRYRAGRLTWGGGWTGPLARYEQRVPGGFDELGRQLRAHPARR